MTKTAKSPVPANYDPRAHLLDDWTMQTIGIIDIEHGVRDLPEGLSREEMVHYKELRRDGYRPVVCIDLDSGVAALEMRKAD